MLAFWEAACGFFAGLCEHAGHEGQESAFGFFQVVVGGLDEVATQLLADAGGDGVCEAGLRGVLGVGGWDVGVLLWVVYSYGAWW